MMQPDVLNLFSGASVDLLEAQKLRESEWVARGAEQFADRIASGDPTMSPAGKTIMRQCYQQLRDGLTRYLDDVGSNHRYPTEVGAYAVTALLGVTQVAAIVLHAATTAILQAGDRPEARQRTVLAVGQTVGAALEHDLRFRAWRNDAAGAERYAVEIMRGKMVDADPRTWASRMAKLRSVATIPWTETDLAVIGMDLLGVLVEWSPQVYTSRTVNIGRKTLKVLIMTEGAADKLALDSAALSVNAPRYGLMLVPPMDWRYVGEVQ